MRSISTIVIGKRGTLRTTVLQIHDVDVASAARYMHSNVSKYKLASRLIPEQR